MRKWSWPSRKSLVNSRQFLSSWDHLLLLRSHETEKRHGSGRGNWGKEGDEEK